jgi:hypothetical protein
MHMSFFEVSKKKLKCERNERCVWVEGEIWISEKIVKNKC